MGRTACTEPQCLYKRCNLTYLTVELYLYSPYGPYGLYRASMPVQGVQFTFNLELSHSSTTPIGRKVFTEPQCLYKSALYLYLTVELYLYSPYWPYGLYSASVPVQVCTLPLTYSRAIPQHTYGPYGLYRASVPVQSALYLYHTVKLYLYSRYGFYSPLRACTSEHFTFTLQ